MSNKGEATVRTRKFKLNRLLKRRQMIVDVSHQGLANVSKAELQERLASMYRTNKDLVILYGFRTKFGGGRSTGFAMIYDDKEALMTVEPEYRLIRAGHSEAVTKSRKQRKERRNRAKKLKGTKKSAVLHG
eukprot:TRINITY_DN55_c0_g1_i1.p1 TRINITY_DN55_c0_g1~~TRINITY_DN55_c0_g1_i1.p1  ORF type:complete len:131 (-),score=29.46 TRINITY_DN55_c0_g1_i1:139-531(-)